jgi:type II secretory pathway component GspD/PulD (secretin)
MLKLLGVALLVIGVPCAGSMAPALAAEETVTADLSLQRLQAEDALVILRSLTGSRGLQVVDEHTIKVTDSAETVELVKVVLDVAEHPSDSSATVPTRELADGSVVVCVRLQHAPVKDVAQALRKEVRLTRLAMEMELATVMVRDTPERVASALAVIRRLDAPQQ